MSVRERWMNHQVEYRVARRKCAKRKGRASRADVAWEWQPLENGRIFSDAPAVRTILEREEASASFKPRQRLSRIFDPGSVKYERSTIHIVWTQRERLFYCEIQIRSKSSFWNKRGWKVFFFILWYKYLINFIKLCKCYAKINGFKLTI